MEQLDKLRSVKHNIQQLIQERNALNEKVELLKQKQAELEDERKQLKNQVEVLENKNVNLRLAKSIREEGSNKEALLKKIDAFIAELDQCIGLLKS